MTQPTNVVIHFKSIDIDEAVREHLEARCEHLIAEFPEATHYELTLEDGANSVDAHCHVTGKNTRAAAHIAGADTPRQAGDQVLDKLERELRKNHDKRIFAPRRKAQKNQPKRMS